MTIHEIITEEHLVEYWEKFGRIAFDGTKKAMLTSCSLKRSKIQGGKSKELPCCFSFTIRRDEHNM